MSVSNLTNTKWVWKDGFEVNIDASFLINFSSNNLNYTQISFEMAPLRISYNSTRAMNFGLWTDEAYRIIEITGGTDATNSILIQWLEANAVQVNTTDLTGTKWIFDSSFTQSLAGKSINFTSNGNSYTSISSDGNLHTLNYDTTRVFDEGWSNQAFRIIEITGGTDVSNLDLLIWLSENAIQVNVTDLTNTKWVFKNTIESIPNTFNFNFASDNTNFTSMSFRPFEYGYLRYDTDFVYNYGGVDEGWLDEAYRIISITNGTDVSNPDLLIWLINNAIQVELTSLENTKWVFNSILSGDFPYYTCSINFSSNNSNFTSMYQGGGNDIMLIYDSVEVYDFDNPAWINEAYRIISITDGSDISNPDLLTWLSQNATQVPVVDLSGTEWVINDSPQVEADYGSFSLNFSSNSFAFISMGLGFNGQSDPESNTILYGDTIYWQTIYNGSWIDNAYKTISISNGIDITDPDLIAWLSKNATLQQTVSYPITVNATNLTYSGDSTINENGTATVTLTASSGYTLPSSITVTGASYTYDSSTGVISLSNPTGNVTITASGVVERYQSSFATTTLNNTILTINGIDYTLSGVPSAGNVAAQENSFNQFFAIDNNDGTITLTVGQNTIIATKYTLQNYLLDCNGNYLITADNTRLSTS